MCDTSGPSKDTTNITITWDTDTVNQSEYDTVRLYEYGNPIYLKEMNKHNKYTFEATSVTLYHFQIKSHVFTDYLSLKNEWNIFSIPFNETVTKTDIIVRNDSIEYNWSEAINQGIILNYIYYFNSTSQMYEFTDILEPGKGYWMWTYRDCELLLHGNRNEDNYISDLNRHWNIIGFPFNESIDTNDLVILYNGNDYSWTNATTSNNEEGEPLILGFAYGWDQVNQMYTLSDVLNPEYGYWMYAYYECTIKKSI